MKKLFLSLILFLAAGAIECSAQKCKAGEDPITGEPVVSFDFNYRAVYFEYRKQAILMEFKMEYIGSMKVSLPAGTEVIFKLENGEILKLKTKSEAIPKSMASSNQYSVCVYSSYSFPFELTKEELNRFATSKIVLIRYPDTQGGTLDFIPKGFSKKIVDVLYKGAKCIHEKIQQP